MTITKKQRTICVIYILVIILMVLFPPVQEKLVGVLVDSRYVFIGSLGSTEMNTSVLLLQILVATIVFSVFFFLGSVKNNQVIGKERIKSKCLSKWFVIIIAALLVGTIGILATLKLQKGGAKEEKNNHSISISMVKVDGGSFQMGSSNGEADEKPVHMVTVNSFWIGKHEITQSEWSKVMITNPSFSSGYDKPVDGVSWYNAVEFCNKLSQMFGLDKVYTFSGDTVTCDFSKNGYRLPTEAEWEYAARGGNMSQNYKYAGADYLKNIAHYDSYASSTSNVGSYSPNELGLYDISGNVWEWCWDWYEKDYYAKAPVDNPCGPSTGKKRVIRGGCLVGEESHLRTSNRGKFDPSSRHNTTGFRVVRTTKVE